MWQKWLTSKVVLQIIRFKSDPFHTNPITSNPNSLNAKANIKILFSKTFMYLLWYFFHTFAYDVGEQAVFLFIIHVLSSVMLSLLLENMLHSLRIFDCTNPIGFKELPFWMGITIFLLHTIISTENKYLLNAYKHSLFYQDNSEH